MYQSNVVPDGQPVVILVSKNLVGGDLEPAVLHGLPDVVSPQHDVDAACSVSAVARSQDPLV